MPSAQQKIVVVIPLYNEQENLAALHDRLRDALGGVGDLDWQVIYVDDGSVDESVRIAVEQHQSDPRFTMIGLSRNFGHQAAVTAGVDQAYRCAGVDAVVVMDADLQDPPEVIPRLIERWREGFEVVYAVRRKRKEHVLKRAAYAGFYRVFKAMARIDVPLDSGDFCLMDRRVVEAIVHLPETNRFLRGLRSWVGFRQSPVEYERSERFAGQSKYTLKSLVRLAMSGFLGFSTAPLRLAVWLGIFAAGGGFMMAIWAVVAKLLGDPAPRGWASTIAVILFLGGIQLLVLGVIGEYLGNVNEEVRRRPVFIVARRHGLDPPLLPHELSPVATPAEATRPASVS